MTGIISGLQTFDIAKLFADGSWIGTSGPENIGLTTVLYIYNTFYNFNELPRASVMSWALFVVILIVSIINFRLKQMGFGNRSVFTLPSLCALSSSAVLCYFCDLYHTDAGIRHLLRVHLVSRRGNL